MNYLIVCVSRGTNESDHISSIRCHSDLVASKIIRWLLDSTDGITATYFCDPADALEIKHELLIKEGPDDK